MRGAVYYFRYITLRLRINKRTGFYIYIYIYIEEDKIWPAPFRGTCRRGVVLRSFAPLVDTGGRESWQRKLGHLLSFILPLFTRHERPGRHEI